MSRIKSIQEILNIAKVTQYLAANSVSDDRVYLGSSLDRNWAITIYMERMSVERKFMLNPTDPTLRDTANYLYAILGKLAIEAERIIDDTQQVRPVVSGPNDMSLVLSGTATFTISVISSLPYTIQWYRNGVLVPGQTGLTYSYSATLSNNGDTVNAVVTNAAGSANSRIATLTVTNVLSADFWFGSSNPFGDLSNGIDNLSYQLNFPITNGQPISVPIPEGAENNVYNVTRYPDTQTIKTTWFNTPLNNGTIGDFVYRDIISFGGKRYIISRNDMSLDRSQPLIFS